MSLIDKIIDVKSFFSNQIQLQNLAEISIKKNIKYLPQNLSDQVDHNRNYNNYENSYSTP